MEGGSNSASMEEVQTSEIGLKVFKTGTVERVEILPVLYDYCINLVHIGITIIGAIYIFVHFYFINSLVYIYTLLCKEIIRFVNLILPFFRIV